MTSVGFTMVVVSFLCCVYYNVIIAWCLYYMYESFGSEVPWKYCGNPWNTEKCNRGRAPLILKFHNNCYRDAIIVASINCSRSVFAVLVIFSVLGFMAEVLSKEVSEVATSGPGLAFVVYPEGLAQMPISPLWSICFFFMLITLGLDTQFAMFEAVTTGLGDEYSKLLKHRMELFIAFLCFVAFLLGIPIVSQSGAYILNLYVWQSGGISLVFLAFFEVVVVGWCYGADRFAKDIEVMIGYKINCWWTLAWKYFTPLVIIVLFFFSLAQWSGVTYGTHHYTPWAEFVGWCMAFASMLFIPGVAIYKIVRRKGPLMERLRFLLKPDRVEMEKIELREGLPKRFTEEEATTSL